MKEDRSYGVVPVFMGKEYEFLIVKHVGGHWGFPKGHREGEETVEETALRELAEETGILKCQTLDTPLIHEEYTFRDKGEEYHKIVKYIIGIIDDKLVTLPNKNEIAEYKWANFDEAHKTLSYDNNREVLREAREFCDKIRE